MRITRRRQSVKDYWSSRWEDIPADEAMDNIHAYPLKYAEQIIKDKKGKILEAGCGAGRIQRYYHNKGMDILGIDFIKIAIDKLKKIDQTLKVEVGDITDLRFDDCSFKYILAFGLYHNLEHGLEKSIQETYRILEPGGSLCASFRADNIQTKIVDWLANNRSGSNKDSKLLKFHKMNLTRSEFKNIFKNEGFEIEFIAPVENMPLLYKFSFFRSFAHKTFDENLARKEGYKLSPLGQLLQNFLMYFFPNQFCNINVMVAHKK